jgi:hypothetical protein
MTARLAHRREQRHGSRRPLIEREHYGGKSPSYQAARPQHRAAICRVDSPIAGRRHAAGILGRLERCGLLWRNCGASSFDAICHASLLPACRCAAGALDRDTGQAGLGIRGDEPWFTSNSASCGARFRFAAGEPKADGTRYPTDWNSCASRTNMKTLLSRKIGRHDLTSGDGEKSNNCVHYCETNFVM